MAKILLESGGIMWKNAIYLFSSILIASLVILISGRYLDGISGSYLGEQKQRLEVQTEYQTELEKVQAGNVYEKLVNKKEISVLIIGDDIAQGGLETEDEKKWYNLLAKRIKEEYGADLTCKNIATPGGTAFDGWIDYITDRERQEYAAQVHPCLWWARESVLFQEICSIVKQTCINIYGESYKLPIVLICHIQRFLEKY